METCPIIGRFVTRFLHLKDGKLHLGTIAIEASRIFAIATPLAVYDKMVFHHDQGSTELVEAQANLNFYAHSQQLSYEGLLRLGKYRGEDASWYDFEGMDTLIQEMHEAYDLPLVPTLNAAQQAARIIAAFFTSAGWSCRTAEADPGDDIEEEEETTIAPPSGEAEGELLELKLPINVVLEGRHVTLVYETPGEASDEYEYLQGEINKAVPAP